MEGFPRQFLPSKANQTIKPVQIPILVSTSQDLLNQPYPFEFLYNSVDSPYIDFSNSFLELNFNITGTRDKNSTSSVVQHSNIYSIIDKITTDLTFVSPTGQDILINYSESSIESSKARKFVTIKELSKDEIDKSMYSMTECLYNNTLSSIAGMEMKEKAQVIIPLSLITGLGTFDCAIKVKSLKMQFVTNYLKNLFTGTTVITALKFDRVYIHLQQIYDINFGNDPRALIKCIPNNCQISAFTTPVYSQASVSGTPTPQQFLSNRSVVFVPDYCMLYFTNQEKSMIPIKTELLKSCQFQIGGQNILPKTDFPTTYKTTNPSQIIPNAMLYNTWRCNSHPQSPLNGEKWYEQPIYIFPISSVVDVNTRSGCEVNISLLTEYTGGTVTGSYTLYAHFIFVKFVRDGATN
ncbi:hypothetical protein WA158_007631 [Blastocystis sp. Blastoise]